MAFVQPKKRDKGDGEGDGNADSHSDGSEYEEFVPKRLMFYPDNKFKNQWDMVITFVLLYTCVLTPA